MAVAWEPTQPVELIVPAGKGGGADQMARLLAQVITAHGLLKQPLLVVNKSGGAGAEGFLHMRASAGNPHKLLMALSNLFTTPFASGIPFNYRDLTPVGMLALDQFVLWVNSAAPYATAREYLDAIKAAPDNHFSMGGTGMKQEDQLLTVALQQRLGKQLSYVSFRGGGEVATQLAEGHVSSTVNNPVEAVLRWRAGQLRPLCVFRTERMPQTAKVTAQHSWSDIPTCKASGIDVDYQMLRGLFLPHLASAEQVAFYTELFQRVRKLPEWGEFIEAGAFEDRFLTGATFSAWLEQAEERHHTWMKEAGFLSK
ncbi:MAG: tripartite tricarboxylate transporter substrate-binding protein [Deltaproteobacteria bacterium]